jgi:hypothetical protein
MDIIDQLRVLGDKVLKLKEQVTTEEATKTAFILPFISLLGYDVFNPMEVIPEFTADLGIKKGEKVDFCIVKDGNPIFIIECKPWTEKLDPHNSQLFRYFHVTKTRFGILTNGIIYRFYTDLEEANKMDEKPFMEFSIVDIKENLVNELKKFHKSSFSVDDIVDSASALKYSGEIRNIISQQLNSPSETFVKFFASQVYQGRLTPKIIDQFSILVKQTLNQFISDSITDRLKSALANESGGHVSNNEAIVTTMVEVVDDAPKVITTNEELECFYLIKGILRNVIKSERISFRDAQSYFSVIIDDNNRKPICRLYLNGSKKQLGLFDSDKKETKFVLETYDDIFNHQTALLETANLYLE